MQKLFFFIIGFFAGMLFTIYAPASISPLGDRLDSARIERADSLVQNVAKTDAQASGDSISEDNNAKTDENTFLVKTRKRSARLYPGISKDEVVKLLGEPDDYNMTQSDRIGLHERLTYKRSSSSIWTLSFENGKLTNAMSF